MTVRREWAASLCLVAAMASSTAWAGPGLVTPVRRELPVRIDQPTPLATLSPDGEDSRHAFGLGGDRARRPVEGYDRALCALSQDPGLQAAALLPDAEGRRPAEAVRPRPGCRPQALRGPVGRSAAGAPDALDWSRRRTDFEPGSGLAAPYYAAAPAVRTGRERGGEAPGFIRQTAPPRALSHDRLSYTVGRDASLGFDGKLVHLRMRYPSDSGDP